MNVGRHTSQALSVAAKRLRLQTRCPFHFGKELADRCIPGSDFDWQPTEVQDGEAIGVALSDEEALFVRAAFLAASDGKIIDMGWNHKEQPMMDHVTSSIYSALGIDYSKVITDTPSGRAYEYQQTAPLGGPSFIPRTEINELFV